MFPVALEQVGLLLSTFGHTFAIECIPNEWGNVEYGISLTGLPGDVDEVENFMRDLGENHLSLKEQGYR